MTTLPLRVIKNAASNLVRGGAAAVVALALPHYLTKILSVEKFAAWSLILQMAAYAAYFDFGLQTAVARYLSQAMERGELDRARGLVNTAFLLLACAGTLLSILIGGVVWNHQAVFHGIPANLVHEFRTAALIMGIGAAIQLPFSAFTGVLVGLQRNELPALAIGSARIAGALAAISVAQRTGSLVALAVIISVASITGGVIQAYMAGRLIPGLRIGFSGVNMPLVREIAHYCSGLTVWSFAMLLVSGLDVIIVGFAQFSAVGYYSLAALLINFFAGLNGSAVAALLAPISVLHARHDADGISKVVLNATRINVMANMVLTAIFFVTGFPLLRIWCGSAYAQPAMPVIKILLVAQTLRLTLSPYSIALISTGEQNRTLGPVMLEGVINLGCSIIGAFVMGPIGVAWGTLVGAVTGVAWMTIRTMPTSVAIPLRLGVFVNGGVVQPLVACCPLFAYAVWWSGSPGPLLPRAAMCGVALFVSCLLFGRMCFTGALSLRSYAGGA
jgi:O-antigen/teichoic acid export membrane protein